MWRLGTSPAGKGVSETHPDRTGFRVGIDENGRGPSVGSFKREFKGPRDELAEAWS